MRGLSAKRTECSPRSSILTSSPGSTSRTGTAPTMSRPHVSEATQKPVGSLPMLSGRTPWGSRAAYTLRSSMITKQNAPWSWGRTSRAAPSSPLPSIAADSIVATRSVSVVAVPCAPTRSCSSRVLTRLPLWPSAIECTPSVLNTGWAFSHVLDPVVE